MTLDPTDKTGKIDVVSLLESSRPGRGHALLMPLVLMVAVIAVLVSTAGESAWLGALVPLAFAGTIGMTLWHTVRLARRQRRELNALSEVDQMIRLGQWDLAVARLGELLGRPMQRFHARLQALIYLGGPLIRLGQYEDAIGLYEYLLSNSQFPAGISFSLRCARLYAMIRLDHLTDAYETIGQMRRESSSSSALLSVLEMYRDVKTGHFEEALGIFQDRKAIFAAQLGHRSCDAWALASWASWGMQRPEQAGMFARNAALLGDRGEILRRFPECAAAFATGGSVGVSAGVIAGVFAGGSSGVSAAVGAGASSALGVVQQEGTPS